MIIFTKLNFKVAVMIAVLISVFGTLQVFAEITPETDPEFFYCPPIDGVDNCYFNPGALVTITKEPEINLKENEISVSFTPKFDGNYSFISDFGHIDCPNLKSLSDTPLDGFVHNGESVSLVFTSVDANKFEDIHKGCKLKFKGDSEDPHIQKGGIIANFIELHLSPASIEELNADITVVEGPIIFNNLFTAGIGVIIKSKKDGIYKVRGNDCILGPNESISTLAKDQYGGLAIKAKPGDAQLVVFYYSSGAIEEIINVREKLDCAFTFESDYTVQTIFEVKDYFSKFDLMDIDIDSLGPEDVNCTIVGGVESCFLKNPFHIENLTASIDQNNIITVSFESPDSTFLYGLHKAKARGSSLSECDQLQHVSGDSVSGIIKTGETKSFSFTSENYKERPYLRNDCAITFLHPNQSSVYTDLSDILTDTATTPNYEQAKPFTILQSPRWEGKYVTLSFRANTTVDYAFSGKGCPINFEDVRAEGTAHKNERVDLKVTSNNSNTDSIRRCELFFLMDGVRKQSIPLSIELGPYNENTTPNQSDDASDQDLQSTYDQRTTSTQSNTSQTNQQIEDQARRIAELESRINASENSNRTESEAQTNDDQINQRIANQERKIRELEGSQSELKEQVKEVKTIKTRLDGLIQKLSSFFRFISF